MIDLIAWFAVALGVVVMGVIVIRKFPSLRAFQVVVHQDAKNARVKGDLLTRRLQRKFLLARSWSRTHLGPFQEIAAKRFHNLVERVERLEVEYRLKSQERMGKLGTSPTQIQKLLGDAAELLKQEEYEKAEQKYIEVISHAPDQLEAYRGLGKLYSEKKDFVHAAESYAYALKLDPNDDHTHLALADVYQSMGEMSRALEEAKSAVAIAENDPKNLGTLLALSIEVRDRTIAETTLERLRTVNPENKKLEEFSERIRELKPR